MSPSKKRKYNAEAAEEQALRENAMHEPLPSKEEVGVQPEPNASQKLCRNAKKAVSKQQMMNSYMRFQSAPEWSEVDAGLASAEGALKLNYVDVDSTDFEIKQRWDTFVQPVSDLQDCFPNPSPGDQQFHHSMCYQDNGGLCASTPHLPLIRALVHSMAAFVTSGPWSIFV